MSKERQITKKEKAVTQSIVLEENGIQAVRILIQAVRLANKKGAFELEESATIGSAKNALEELLK